MSWLQLRLDTGEDAARRLEPLLLAAGAAAVTLQDNADQPVLEPAPGTTPLWARIRLTGLFAADADMAAVLDALPAALLAHANPRIEILEDRDWEREWMRDYRPMRFGERLWVCPSWREPPQPDAVNLLLDPGLAFGTGTHPTTALCLTALDGMPLAGRRVVDYGCGSGILALAALKLGAGSVLGVDDDPQALTASRDNAARNAIEPARLHLAAPGAPVVSRWSRSADVVVANILAGPLMDLSGTLTGLLRPGGTLLLSGLLATQATQLQAHYGALPTLTVTGEREGWVCLRGELATR